MKYDKNYYEKYALLSLIYCYNNSLTIMKKSEEPDWKSEELGIGLEVVRAISKKEGEEKFIVNEYFGKGLGGELVQKAVSKRFPRYKNLIKSYNNIAYTSTDYCNNVEERAKKIEKFLIEKTEKLNRNYEQFYQNWLYVFADTAMLNDFDIELIINRNREKFSEFKVTFDKIFINTIDRLYVIYKYEKYEKIQVEYNTLKRLKRESNKQDDQNIP